LKRKLYHVTVARSDRRVILSCFALIIFRIKFRVGEGEMEVVTEPGVVQAAAAPGSRLVPAVVGGVR
jgi:hypothetical protein